MHVRNYFEFYTRYVCGIWYFIKHAGVAWILKYLHISVLLKVICVITSFQLLKFLIPGQVCYFNLQSTLINIIHTYRFMINSWRRYVLTSEHVKTLISFIKTSLRRKYLNWHIHYIFVKSNLPYIGRWYKWKNTEEN